jgi:hypothetical protein
LASLFILLVTVGFLVDHWEDLSMAFNDFRPCKVSGLIKHPE